MPKAAQTVDSSVVLTQSSDLTHVTMDRKWSIAMKLATLAVHTAKAAPRAFIPWYQASNKIGLTSGADPDYSGTGILSVTGALQRVREILRDQFGRELIRERGVGFRASINTLDAFRNVTPKVLRRVQTANENLVEHTKVVDIDFFPSTLEGKRAKKTFGSEIKPVVQAVTTSGPNLEQALSFLTQLVTDTEIEHDVTPIRRPTTAKRQREAKTQEKTAKVIKMARNR